MHSIVRGIVHPRMKITTLNHMSYFLLWNVIEDILKNVCNQTGLFPIDFFCIFFHTLEAHGPWSLKLVTNIFKFHRRKKVTQDWKSLRVSKC